MKKMEFKNSMFHLFQEFLLFYAFLQFCLFFCKNSHTVEGPVTTVFVQPFDASLNQEYSRNTHRKVIERITKVCFDLF